jgi:hypothetical protein
LDLRESWIPSLILLSQFQNATGGRRSTLDVWNEEAPGHSPVPSAAIVHYRFEAIHPFADGNGRAGRASRWGALRPS